MRSINEEDVKDILKNREEKIKSNRERMYNLYEELDSDMLLQMALPGIRMDGMPGAKGAHHDLGDLVENYKKRTTARNREVREAMWALSEEEEMINRVWICFCALPDPYYTILKSLYVEKQLYEAVRLDMGMAIRTFENQRKKGIDLLIRFFRSGKTAADLIRQSGTREIISSRRRKHSDKEGYEQIRLTDLE